MSATEIVLLGLALSADAFSVTVSNSCAFGSHRRARLLLMPVLFGVFQGIMPLFGYLLGGVAASLIERYAGLVTLIILGIIGINMVREGARALAHPEDGCPKRADRLTIGILLFQAVATAIDAFAVGVSLRAQATDIWVASVIICCTTAVCCVAALAIGHRMGRLLGDRAEIAGGVVLMLIGLRAFLS